MSRWNKLISVLALLMLLLSIAVPALAMPAVSPGARESMHDVQQNEQRNVTPGGAGIPGGTNPYFATARPSPTPMR